MISNEQLSGVYATAALDGEYCAVVVTKYIKDYKSMIAEFMNKGASYSEAFEKLGQLYDSGTVSKRPAYLLSTGNMFRGTNAIVMPSGGFVFFVSAGTLPKLRYFDIPREPCRILIDPELSITAAEIMKKISKQETTKDLTEWLDSIPVRSDIPSN